MNANAVAKKYTVLTPEERFRLILAASGRGDEAERDRLANSGEFISLAVRDHQPYSQAFEELARLIFIELLEDAARYEGMFIRAGEAGRRFDEEEDPGEPADEADGAGDGETE